MDFDKSNSLFALIGNYGSVVNLYDSKTFAMVNSIPVKGHLIKELTFSDKPFELIIITADASMRFYDI